MAKKILLAEDSVTMQKVVQLTFAGEDFTVTSASTVDEALERANEMDPDIVLADLSMPGKTGYDLCATLKRNGTRAPILLLHGSAVGFDEERARNVQADAHLAKPFDTQGLIDRVQELLSDTTRVTVSGPIESLSAPIESGGEDIVIDPGIPAVPPPRAPTPYPPPSVVPTAPARASMPPQVEVSLSGASGDKAGPSPASTHPITIEAELPPAGGPEPLEPFDNGDEPTMTAARPPQHTIEASYKIRTSHTLIGTGAPDLPPPPPGMPLPPARLAASAAPVPVGAPAAGQLDPAVYEAISKLSREVIEKVVWQVVPDLAERLIKEEIDRLVESRAR